jgi:pyruvate dehydrogenase E2 component (dihydrolipoamide acetyltransferase)
MTEGTVVQWLKAEGDPVAAGDTIYDVETDKLTNTVEATAEGILLKILVEAGQTVDCLVPVAVIGEAGEDISGLIDAAPQTQSAPEPQAAATAPKTEERTAATASPGGRIIASPAAKKLAKEKGVDLATVTGTGPNGRITTEDVEQSLQNAPKEPKASGLAQKIATEQGVDLATVPADGRIMAADVRNALALGAPAPDEILPMNGMRKVIAKRMRESVDISPTVAFNISADVSALKRIREEFKAEDIKVSITDLLALFVSRLLLEHPFLNCSVDGTNLILHHYVNLGIAAAVPGGLFVPVVRDADRKDILTLSREIKELALAAREGKLSPDSLSGGTFTITNLGMFGIESFTPIINQPEVAILGVNAIQDTVVAVDGVPVIKPLMRLSLVTDHRAIDGAVAAEFLSKLKKLIEKPALILSLGGGKL